jgi:Tfp pilus assembly protein PilO
MSARLSSASPRALAIGASLAVLLYAAALWFVLVSPKRADAAHAGDKVAAAELRLAEVQMAANRPPGKGEPVADVFRLAKAMPGSTDQPGLVLEISRLASRSGVTLRSITPETPLTEVGEPTLIPLSVGLTGSYAQITKFLLQTRSLVTVRDERIQARGRLLSVQSVTLAESVDKGFPKLDATVVLDAYVYDGPIVPVEPDPADVPEEEPSSSGTSAAGSTH